jgi:hypothetical protein
MRTDSGKVAEELMDDYDGKAKLTRFMRQAHAITNRVEYCARVIKNKPLTADELLEIETLAAAHYYVMSDQTLAQKSTEGASGSFHGQTGMYMEASKYGQSALRLDWSGCLEAIDKRKFAGGFWPGTVPFCDDGSGSGVSGDFGQG